MTSGADVIITAVYDLYPKDRKQLLKIQSVKKHCEGGRIVKGSGHVKVFEVLLQCFTRGI